MRINNALFCFCFCCVRARACLCARVPVCVRARACAVQTAASANTLWKTNSVSVDGVSRQRSSSDPPAVHPPLPPLRVTSTSTFFPFSFLAGGLCRFGRPGGAFGSHVGRAPRLPAAQPRPLRGVNSCLSAPHPPQGGRSLLPLSPQAFRQHFVSCQLRASFPLAVWFSVCGHSHLDYNLVCVSPHCQQEGENPRTLGRGSGGGSPPTGRGGTPAGSGEPAPQLPSPSCSALEVRGGCSGSPGFALRALRAFSGFSCLPCPQLGCKKPVPEGCGCWQSRELVCEGLPEAGVGWSVIQLRYIQVKQQGGTQSQGGHTVGPRGDMAGPRGHSVGPRSPLFCLLVWRFWGGGYTGTLVCLLT